MAFKVRSDVAVPWTTDAASYRLFSSAGIALYCVRVTGAAPVVGRAGLNCYAIDRDGVRGAGHQTEAMIAAVPPDPVATAESARYLHLQRAPGEALGELVRFDGTDFQCVRDGTSQACLRTDSLAAANPAQTFLDLRGNHADPPGARHGANARVPHSSRRRSSDRGRSIGAPRCV
jgi:hypothetical protein